VVFELLQIMNIFFSIILKNKYKYFLILFIVGVISYFILNHFHSSQFFYKTQINYPLNNETKFSNLSDNFNLKKLNDEIIEGLIFYKNYEEDIFKGYPKNEVKKILYKSVDSFGQIIPNTLIKQYVDSKPVFTIVLNQDIPITIIEDTYKKLIQKVIKDFFIKKNLFFIKSIGENNSKINLINDRISTFQNLLINKIINEINNSKLPNKDILINNLSNFNIINHSNFNSFIIFLNETNTEIQYKYETNSDLIKIESLLVEKFLLNQAIKELETISTSENLSKVQQDYTKEIFSSLEISQSEITNYNIINILVAILIISFFLISLILYLWKYSKSDIS